MISPLTLPPTPGPASPAVPAGLATAATSSFAALLLDAISPALARFAEPDEAAAPAHDLPPGGPRAPGEDPPEAAKGGQQVPPPWSLPMRHLGTALVDVAGSEDVDQAVVVPPAPWGAQDAASGAGALPATPAGPPVAGEVGADDVAPDLAGDLATGMPRARRTPGSPPPAGATSAATPAATAGGKPGAAPVVPPGPAAAEVLPGAFVSLQGPGSAPFVPVAGEAAPGPDRNAPAAGGDRPPGTAAPGTPPADVAAHAHAHSALGGTPAAGATEAASPSLLAQRVADAVERLELAPPPRRMTVELGDVRVSVSLQGETVRVAVLGSGAPAPEGWARDLSAALSARGLALESEAGADRGSQDRGARHPDERSPPPGPQARRRPTSRPAAAGWRL